MKYTRPDFRNMIAGFALLLVCCAPAISRAQAGGTEESLKPFLTKQGYVAVPLQRLITGHLYTSATLNGVKGMFILDSGAGATVLEETKKDKFKVAKGKNSEEKAIGAGAGQLAVVTSMGNKFSVGDYKQDDYTIRLISLESINSALRSMGIIEADGIIGADILTSGDAIIDYKNMTVYLK